jgi:hypothetical protein
MTRSATLARRDPRRRLRVLPQCGEGVRHGQHDHIIIGRNEIGVQHMIKAFSDQLDVALSC